MLPRSSVCLLKGVSKAVQGGSRGVATVMADLPEEHVSFDRHQILTIVRVGQTSETALCPGCMAEPGARVCPGGVKASCRHLRQREELSHRAGDDVPHK